MFLGWRIYTSLKQGDNREIVIGKAEIHRDHLLIYLFAMLLPIYAINLNDWRDLSAAIAAAVFIIFLFWHLNLHYVNLCFAIFGYRVFTLFPAANRNTYSGKELLILISKRRYIPDDEKLIVVYRLSDTVYLEMDK